MEQIRADKRAQHAGGEGDGWSLVWHQEQRPAAACRYSWRCVQGARADGGKAAIEILPVSAGPKHAAALRALEKLPVLLRDKGRNQRRGVGM